MDDICSLMGLVLGHIEVVEVKHPSLSYFLTVFLDNI